jgi:hypothetical protein
LVEFLNPASHNIVWERGGLDRFGAVAREAAAAMAALSGLSRSIVPTIDAR